MAKFDLASVLGDVSKLDTGIIPEGREQIEYIDLGLIDPDPNNFYELSGLDELAANIELLGLQQPLRVRENPEQPGRWIIVSGHRRRAAMELLAKEGKDKFASVPCIREAAAGSAALQELRLIYANSDTRKLTSAEISKQAERVEALLYQLKEEGMEFPGRMRDHVAEACKVSKSKLARLKVIRDNLDKGLKKCYEKGDLTESVAYTLAQQPVEIQRAVFDYKCTGKYGTKYLREWEVGDVAKNYLAITEQMCELSKSGKCEHGAALLGKIYNDTYGYKPCSSVKCCNKCEKLASCKIACPMLKEKIQKLKADKKEAMLQEQLAKEEKERPDVELLTKLWARFGQARVAAKKSVRQVFKVADMYYTESEEAKRRDLENGVAKISPNTALPYSYRIDLVDVKRLIALADLLGCSLDYLFCRTDVPKMNTGRAASAWYSGTPDKSGLVVAILEFEGVELDADIYYFDVDTGQFRSASGALLFPAGDLVECIRWFPLPED